MRSRKPAIWLLLLVIAYTAGHALWYGQTPLGQIPALDGQENLILAERIANGTLEREPFYRAALYPAILAISPIPWMLLGALCHILNTMVSMGIARRIWPSPKASLITGALVGFNPVLLHFAVDPLDITFAITCFLSALFCLLPIFDNRDIPALRITAGGVLIALAALARPHFFAILVPISVAAIVSAIAYRPYRRRAAILATACVAPLAAFGYLQKAHSGSFRIMPTQGGFALWVSNHDKANGLYYKQSLNFHYADEHKNPARLESEALFTQDTGKIGNPDDIAAHWKGKTADYILANPGPWARLMGFKAYAWINDFEQYNNKTYSFHKSLSPWLKFNPIGWGLLLTLAALATGLSYPSGNRRALIAGLALIALFSTGALMYMASARFRLPLAPLLAIGAGGLPFVASQWHRTAWGAKSVVTGATLILAIGAFSRFGNITSKSTYQQDTMLLADAASRTGNDREAFHWTEQTLERNPDRLDARRLRLLAYYNLVAIDAHGFTGKSWSDFRVDLGSVSLDDPASDFVHGVALWNLGDRSEAADIWIGSFERHGWNAASSFAAMLHTKSPLPPKLPRFAASAYAPNALLIHALSQPDRRVLRDQIGLNVQPDEHFLKSVGESFNRVLPTGKPAG